MIRLAITGHRGLPADTARIVEAALRAEVNHYAGPGGLIGISALADGADTLFASVVLDAGGQLHVIVPAEQYRAGLPAEHHPAYDALFASATHVTRLGYNESTEDAHMAASVRMFGEADRVLAVWDGKPARGYGGTADVVAAARDHGLPVTIIWPEGAHRD